MTRCGGWLSGDRRSRHRLPPRNRCFASRHPRSIRNARLFREPAHSRDRHPYGCRCDKRARISHDRSSGFETERRRNCRGPNLGSSDRLGDTRCVHAGESARSARIWSSGGRTCRGHIALVLLPCADRSERMPPLRVATHASVLMFFFLPRRLLMADNPLGRAIPAPCGLVALQMDTTEPSIDAV